MSIHYTIKVRLNRKWIMRLSALGLVGLGAMLFLHVSSDAPVFAYSSPALAALSIAMWVALIAFGGVPYLKVTPKKVTQAGIFFDAKPFKRGNSFNRSIDLYPGDALVVTRDELLIWRCHLGRYEQLGARSAHANPEDWKRLQQWAAAIWPQPLDYSHQRAVIE
ncbi:hypothetical protein [Glycomyces tarimensis]